MRKLTLVCVAALLAAGLAFSVANAASSKATAVSGKTKKAIGFRKASEDGWITVMQNDIRIAQRKDLFIDVSMEVGLTTNTKVMSKFLKRDISEAEALVKVRVRIDNGAVPVVPGEDGVTFSRRTQALIAEFAGALAYKDANDDLVNCMSVELDDEGNPTGALIIDEDCVEEETLGLIMDTMAAHSFNFIAKDVPVGMHTIQVQALVGYTQIGESSVDELNELTLIGAPATSAYLGQMSVTVEEVSMVKDEDIDPPEI